MLADSSYESQAIFEWLDWKTSHGEAQVGHGVQRIFGVCRWIYELTGI